MAQKGVSCPSAYQFPSFGEIRPVIGVHIPNKLARRLGLDSAETVWVQKDGHDGKVEVRGRCNGSSKEFHVPIEDLHLTDSQRQSLRQE